MTPVPQTKLNKILDTLASYIASGEKIGDLAKYHILEDLKILLNVEPISAHIGFAIIATHFDKNEIKMEKHYKSALMLDPEDSRILYNYSVALWNFKRATEAQEVLLRAVETSHKNPNILHVIARTAYLYHYHEVFQKVLNTAKKLNITSPDIELISKEALISKCESTVFNAADYFIALQGDCANITNIKIQILCAYAQAFSLALIERPLFQEHITAPKSIPIISSLYKVYKHYEDQYIPNNGLSKAQVRQPFDDEQKFALELVNNYYGEYSVAHLQQESYIDFDCPPEASGIISKTNILKTFKNHHLLRKLQDANLVTEFDPATNRVVPYSELVNVLGV